MIKSRNIKKKIKKLYNPVRNESEIYINDYNPVLLIANQGNMDIQYVGENSNILNYYLTTCIAKSEFKSIQEIFDNLEKNKSLNSRIYKAAYQILSCRKTSIQEAICKILSFPLYVSDVKVKYLSVGRPSERTYSFKPKYLLEALNMMNLLIYIITHFPLIIIPLDLKNLKIFH